MTRPIAAINGLQGFRYPLFLLGHCEKVSAVGLMCENSSNSDSTDAWIAVVNSAMTSKCHDSLGGDEDAVREDLKDKILELLQKRAESSTICPSEAPRALRPETWRDFMDVTREVARQLALDGRIEITQKGRAVDPEAPLRGPIRLRLAPTSAPPNSN